jgi:chloramphenicol O-acetyltransferase type B
MMKWLRRLIYGTLVRVKAESTGRDLQVNGWSTVTRRTVLGDNVNFNGMSIIGRGKVAIGSNFHSGGECIIISEVHNYDRGKAIPYDNTVIEKDVVIEDNVWFGSRVIVLGGVTIGEGAIIQAGSVVVKNIPACAMAGGNPAQVFKNRDKKHYERLKEEGKFM